MVSWKSLSHVRTSHRRRQGTAGMSLLLLLAVIACAPASPREPEVASTPLQSNAVPSQEMETEVAFDSGEVEENGEGDEAASEAPAGASGAAGSADPAVEGGHTSAEADSPAEAHEPAAPDPPRSPVALLTAPGVSFMIDYLNSGARKAAEAACAEKSEEPAERAACLSEARTEFKPDVLLFDEVADKRWSLVVYKREGSLLSEVYSADVKLEDASRYTATLKLVGAQRGQRPAFLGTGTITISVPTDAILEVADPRHGSLPYRAKIGLVGRR